MTKEELLAVLGEHELWLSDETKGKRANLSDANLSHADLRHADLRYANLSDADLSGADLSDADLSDADLHDADLHDADLSDADLRGADLRYANLIGANNLSDLAAAQTEILPRTGTVRGFKKASGYMVEVEVLADARRSNSTGRKCRAEAVKVIAVIGAEIAKSSFDDSVIYKAGEIVRCDKWNEDRWTECGGGIHFFLTQEEAEDYN